MFGIIFKEKGDIMQELVKLGEKTYVLLEHTNVGFYLVNDNEVVVIDTGSSKDSAKLIDKILVENNWHLKCIINTHSHADHMGGNAYLENKYNVKAYSSSMESFICNNPILEPSLLYSAAPVKELKNHLLMAKPSHSLDINELDIPGIEVLDLKGHAIGQIGILTSDDVLFTGDAYTSTKILEKYAIQYNYDIEEYINTLDYLLTTDYKYYVPSHGEVEKNCTNTVMINKENALKIEDYLLKILQEEKSFANLLSQVFNDYHITNNLMQYHLIGSTIKAFLAKLNNAGKVEITVRNGEMYIKAI